MRKRNPVRYGSAVFLLLAMSAAVGAANDAPSAREILDRHVTAIGGEKAILSPRGIHYIGTFDLQGLEGTFELHRGDQQVLFALEAPGIGSIRQGYDGETAWAIQPTGPALLDGVQLEQMVYEASPSHELRRSGAYSSIKSLGLSDVDGDDFYAVELVTPAGDVITEYYDPESGLRHASVSTQQTAVGPQEIAVLYSKYRRFGDLEVASRIEQRGGGQVLVRIIDEVHFGPVDNAVFALPDEIVELRKAKQ